MMFSLNADDAVVVHTAVTPFGDDASVCGFVATNLDGIDVCETVATDPARVTCADCLVAIGEVT